MSPLAAIVLVWMVALQPPNDPTLRVSPELAASYPETAQEIADAAERDPLEHDARLTAAILTVMAQRESRFAAEPCTKQWDCDHGASLGKFQTWSKWGPPTADTALWVLHRSWEVCRKRPVEERIAWYAAGGVGCDRRLELSRARMQAAAKLAKSVVP